MTTTRRILPAVLLFAFIAGCDGSGDSILDQFAAPSGSEPLDPGEGTISGDFGIGSASLNGSFAWSDRWTNPSSGQEQGFIVLSDDPDMCNDLEAVSLTASSEFAILQVIVVTATVDAPTEPGDFEIDGPSGNVAFANYYALDADCGDAGNAELATGTVTLTAVSGNHFEGTFDGETAGDDRVRGGFNPANCFLDPFFAATSVICNP